MYIFFSLHGFFIKKYLEVKISKSFLCILRKTKIFIYICPSIRGECMRARKKAKNISPTGEDFYENIKFSWVSLIGLRKTIKKYSFGNFQKDEHISEGQKRLGLLAKKKDLLDEK